MGVPVKFTSAFIFTVSLLSSVCARAYQLSHGLNSSDRIKALQILALGSSTKRLHLARPLGLDNGLETSFQYESIPTDQLEILGDKSGTKGSLRLFKLEVGKGLFNNIDLHFQLLPYTSTTQFSGYGASVRWQFFESPFVPARLFLSVQGSSSNLANQMLSQTLGTDLSLGMFFEHVSFTVKAGMIKAFGKFMGGSDGVTLDQSFAAEQTQSSHFGADLLLELDGAFGGVGIDHFTQTVINAKFGYRF